MVDFDNCKSVISRIVEAYKLNTVKSLCDHLGIGVSVISNRINRNTFPAELIVRCSLDTGANLYWLCTGEGEPDIEGFQPVKKIVLPDDVLEKLERLTALKEKGSITEQEFNLLKGNLLK